LPESLFAAAGLEIGPEGFADRARALIARIDGGESVDALAPELGELRAAWKLFGAVEREELKGGCGGAVRTDSSPGTLASVPSRRYDGPRDPTRCSRTSASKNSESGSERRSRRR